MRKGITIHLSDDQAEFMNDLLKEFIELSDPEEEEDPEDAQAVAEQVKLAEEIRDALVKD